MAPAAGVVAIGALGSGPRRAVTLGPVGRPFASLRWGPESGGDVVVEAMDPGLISVISAQAAFQPIAGETRRLVGDVLARINTPV
jgi:hypothetical protein